MNKIKICILALICSLVCVAVHSRRVALKTNVLYDATATVNLGMEFKLAPRWSLDVSGNFNGWILNDGTRWKHWMIQPEARFWLCDASAGHFFALHALGGQYNIGHLRFARDFMGYNFSTLRDHRYQGWLAGAGIGYGYSWILGKHWNLEAELGLGWIHTRYDIFECEGCGRRVGESSKDFFLPTKAAINFVYLF